MDHFTLVTPANTPGIMSCPIICLYLFFPACWGIASEVSVLKKSVRLIIVEAIFYHCVEHRRRVVTSATFLCPNNLLEDLIHAMEIVLSNSLFEIL